MELNSELDRLSKYNVIDAELQKAEKKHPTWPEDVIYAVAIMQEESGEAIRAAVQYQMEGGSIEDVKKELIHTAAMCMRCLKNL